MEAASQGNYQAIRIDRSDNVATATKAIPAGTEILVVDKTGLSQPIAVVEAIPANHKLALQPIKTGSKVVKYGHSIGQTTQDVKAGGWVHVHNLKSLRGRGKEIE